MANQPQQPGAGRSRPESRYIVAIGDIVRARRADEFHEGAVVIRRMAEQGILGKLIQAMPYFSGGQNEALTAMVVCLAREYCFYCQGNVRRCAFCNGSGLIPMTGTTCRGCGGQGLTSCSFCGDTGLSNIDAVPANFRSLVVRERAIFGIKCLKEAQQHYQQSRPPLAQDRVQVRQNARLAVSFSRRARAILLEAKAAGARPPEKINRLLNQAELIMEKSVEKIVSAGRRRPGPGGPTT